jgi:DNA-binding response OmpR family regulator
MAKILLVEDDQELARTISKWFTLEHHTVETVHDGLDGLDRIMVGSFDVIVLDWMLPSLDGIELCRRYRAARGVTPIIMLTGKSMVSEKELGLDNGADDYLTKPFSVRELSARVRALLRRPQDPHSDVITNGPIILETASRKITREGSPVELLPIDFAVLEFFMRNAGEVFSTEALIERIWHSDSRPSDNAVRSSIKRIRQAIDSNEADSLIETVNRVGYRLRKIP